MEFLKKIGGAILSALRFLARNSFNVVTILIALIIYPVAYTLNLIFIQISTSDMLSPIFEMINQGGEQNLGGMGLEVALSLQRIINIVRGEDDYSFIMDYINTSEGFSFPAALDPIKGKLITAVVCFVLALLIALFIIIWCFISKKRFPVLIASLAGTATTVTMIITFTSASRFITSDTFKISDLLGDAGWIAELVSGIIQVDTFSLGGFEIGFLAVFIGILIWTGAFYLVELGEPKDAPAKKKK